MISPYFQQKVHKFKFYLRQCNRCNEIFEAPTKKCRICDLCKPLVNKEKVERSLIARGIIIKIKTMGVEYDNNKLDSKLINNR